MIPRALVHDLVVLGRGGVPAIPARLANKERAWRLLICGNQPWLDVAETLRADELRNLIRGLVLYSVASGSSGGSVSPVIVLYWRYVERSPADEPELTSWIADKRVNDYEPFGTAFYGGARSLQEFRENGIRRLHWRVERAALEREAAAWRRERAGSLATELLPNAVRRGDLAAVKALLQRGANGARALPGGQSLLTIVGRGDRDKMVEFLRLEVAHCDFKL